MQKFLNIIDSVNSWAGRIVSLAIVPMIILVVVEVIRRYGFNAPSEWSFEISRFFFGGYIVLGGAYTLLLRGHVNMDLVYSRFSLKKRAILDVCTAVLFFLFCGTFLVEAWKLTWEAFQTGERVGTGAGYDPYLWPIYAALCLGAFLILLQGIADFIRNWMIIANRGRKVKQDER